MIETYECTLPQKYAVCALCNVVEKRASSLHVLANYFIFLYLNIQFRVTCKKIFSKGMIEEGESSPAYVKAYNLLIIMNFSDAIHQYLHRMSEKKLMNFGWLRFLVRIFNI